MSRHQTKRVEVVIQGKSREFDVHLIADSDGGFTAVVDELPGCVTEGDTLYQTLENVREAIVLYLEE